jgi:hypothetical protein
MLPALSGSGNASIDEYLADLGYNRDMIEWATTATAAGLSHLQCLNPELAKKFYSRFT